MNRLHIWRAGMLWKNRDWNERTSYEESGCYFIGGVSNEQTSYMKSWHAKQKTGLQWKDFIWGEWLLLYRCGFKWTDFIYMKSWHAKQKIGSEMKGPHMRRVAITLSVGFQMNRLHIWGVTGCSKCLVCFVKIPKIRGGISRERGGISREKGGIFRSSSLRPCSFEK